MKSSIGPAVGFVMKVVVVSAAISALIKLAGLWVPVPDEPRLNQIAIAVVLLPATVVGAALAVALKRS